MSAVGLLWTSLTAQSKSLCIVFLVRMKKDHLAHEQRDAADDDAPGSDDDSSSDDDGDGADDSDVDVVGGARNGVAPADREIQVSSLVFSTLKSLCVF